MAVVAVAGNVNADISYDVERLPAPGETLLAGGLRVGPGGKAGNGSVAVARLGGEARTISSVGDDPLGQIAIAALHEAGVDTEWVVRRAGETTGAATVLVAPPGEENAIVTHLGANLLMGAHDVPGLHGCDALVLTLGLPEPALLACVDAAARARAITIVDATPLRGEAPPSALTEVDVLTANRVEAQQLTGALEPDAQVAGMHDLGARAVVLKLGPDGAAWSDGTHAGRALAPRVDAVDPTGAGDAFTAALAVRTVAGDSLEDATAYACVVGALATTGRGAQGGWTSVEDVARLQSQTGSGLRCPHARAHRPARRRRPPAGAGGQPDP